MSLFIKKIASPLECLIPKLLPPANPKFLSDLIVITSGYILLIWYVSSTLEPLSTTIISDLYVLYKYNDSITANVSLILL